MLATLHTVLVLTQPSCVTKTASLMLKDMAPESPEFHLACVGGTMDETHDFTVTAGTFSHFIVSEVQSFAFNKVVIVTMTWMKSVFISV